MSAMVNDPPPTCPACAEPESVCPCSEEERSRWPYFREEADAITRRIIEGSRGGKARGTYVMVGEDTMRDTIMGALIAVNYIAREKYSQVIERRRRRRESR